MEFGNNTILMALGALVVIAILWHGIRQLRRSRYDNIRMSRRKQPIFDDDHVDEFGSELPNGGARVVGTRDDLSTVEKQEQIRQAAEAKKPKLAYTLRGEGEEAPESEVELDDPDWAEPIVEQAEAVSEPVEEPELEPIVAAEEPVRAPEQSSLGLDEPVEEIEEPVEEEEEAPQEVIVFHLRAPKGAPYQGEAPAGCTGEAGYALRLHEDFPPPSRCRWFWPGTVQRGQRC